MTKKDQLVMRDPIYAWIVTAAAFSLMMTDLRRNIQT